MNEPWICRETGIRELILLKLVNFEGSNPPAKNAKISFSSRIDSGSVLIGFSHFYNSTPTITGHQS